MTLATQRLVLAIVATTVLAFSAGVGAGRATATQQQSSAAPPVLTNPTTDYSAPPRLCHSSLGPDDYETCKAQFGEQ